MSKPALRNKRFKVSLSEKELAELKKFAKKNDVYMAEAARSFILRGLKGSGIKHNRSECL